MVGKRKFTEDDVLEAATTIFWEKGYLATTMQDLAEASAVQRGSLYNTFGSKQEIFVRVFKRYTEKYFLILETDLQQPCIISALDKVFSSIVKRLTGDPDRKGCFTTKIIMEVTHQTDDLDFCLQYFLDGLEKLFTQRLQQAIKDKQFTGNAKSTARYLVALTRGIAVTEKIYHNKAYSTDIYKTALTLMPLEKKP